MDFQHLQTYIKRSSVKGLSSITTLIVGQKSAVLIDPPFLLADANVIVSWIKETTSHPLKGVFVTHHHPDHYFSANPILEAFPSAGFYAAPYVRANIVREYDQKVKYWPSIYGKESFPPNPRKPDPYPYSLVTLEGNEGSPIILLGPVQGDCVDHTLFWLPSEKTIITGDAMYGRSTHVWAEEIETPQILHAWRTTINLIESLQPTKIIPGHIDEGWELDTAADLAHNKRYLALFEEKIQNASQQPTIQDIYTTFEEAFPQAKENLDFFLGHLSQQFGEGGKVWEENRHQEVGQRTTKDLEGFVM